MYEKYEPQSKKDINMHESVNDLFIERNTLVSSNIQINSGGSKMMITKDYRVPGIYGKSYNKWFIYGEKKSWGDKMNTEDKKKYKIAICMIEEGVLIYFL